MIKAATILFAIVFALNGGLDALPIKDEHEAILHWLFAGILAGLGVFIGPTVVEAVKRAWETKAP